MSPTASARFRRIVSILPRIAGGHAVRIDALAAETGVPHDQLIRDLQTLAERYDVPAAFVEGVAVAIDGDSVSVRTDHFHRPMRLTAAELCALELGLSLLACERDADQAALIARLRSALTELIIALPRDAAYAGLRDGALMESARGDALPAVRRAIRANRVLRISYQGASATHDTARDVHPHALVFSRGCWFLVAFCERSDAMRMFRTDRIASAEPTERTFMRPRGVLLDDMMVDGKPFLPPSTETLTVRYRPAIARWIAERDGKALEADGSAVRTMPLADREWAIRHVLQYGPDAEIMAPRELRGEVMERLRAMLAHQDTKGMSGTKGTKARRD